MFSDKVRRRTDLMSSEDLFKFVVQNDYDKVCELLQRKVEELGNEGLLHFSIFRIYIVMAKMFKLSKF